MLSQCRSCGQRMDSPRSYGERNRDMANPKVRMYREQSFGHLKGLAGISDRQVAEQLALYAGYVRQVNRRKEKRLPRFGSEAAGTRVTPNWPSARAGSVSTTRGRSR